MLNYNCRNYSFWRHKCHCKWNPFGLLPLAELCRELFHWVHWAIFNHPWAMSNSWDHGPLIPDLDFTSSTLYWFIGMWSAKTVVMKARFQSEAWKTRQNHYKLKLYWKPCEAAESRNMETSPLATCRLQVEPAQKRGYIGGSQKTHRVPTQALWNFHLCAQESGQEL